MDEKKVTGFQNESDFSNAIDQKEFCQLDPCAARFIRQLYPSVEDETVVNATRIGGMGLKPDVVVSVNGDETNVSIKKGGGNSVHQEKISYFLLYCKENLGMPDDVRDSFLAYFYGDGTLDGKGLLEDRLDGDELRDEYSDEIKKIQAFLLDNSRPLIERFLVYGRRGRDLNVKADYLYHGHITDGVWCPLDETVDFLVEKAVVEATVSAPAIGPLTLQTWNRNLSGEERLEDRRHSLQIKWGGRIKEYISEINARYLEKIRNNPQLAEPRIFGDNSHGFSNAREIAEGMDGCRVMNLRGALLGLINTVFPGAALTDIVRCSVINAAKPDLRITIGERSANVSIFVGSGNSVHQENFVEFLAFCRESLGMTAAEESALRFIYYGDGTVGGTGNVADRLPDSRTIKQRYPLQTSVAQAFFDKHRRELASRFLVTGKSLDKPNAEYVFHGNVQNGIAISYNAVLDYIERYEGTGSGLLSIGPLSFQIWNRNLSGDAGKEYKRESLQIKWSSMPLGIAEACAMQKANQERSRIDGINAEYELVSLLNRNRTKTNPLWSIFSDSFGVPSEDVYAIRVSQQVYSDFLGQTIYPKSDVYLCRANIPEEVMHANGYALDEDLVKEFGIDVIPLPGSGISCKIASSTKFTYSKIGVANFVKIFGDAMMGAGASLFVRDKDIKLNSEVLKAWNVCECDFVSEYLPAVGIEGGFSSIHDLDVVAWHAVKRHSIHKIEESIRNNDVIANMIFLGKGLYDDPYCASYIFSGGKLDVNRAPETFTVTTGSGRHKGKFTIVIKP